MGHVSVFNSESKFCTLIVNGESKKCVQDTRKRLELNTISNLNTKPVLVT